MPREACRALITDETGMRLLLAKRAEDDYEGGLWCALGGTVDPGESPEIAVSREAFEEAGLVLEGLELFRTHKNPDWVTHFYAASASGVVKLDPAEHSEIGYFDETELVDLALAFDHQHILVDFLRSR